MLLAVDIGNTNIKLGVFSGETLREQFRTDTRRDQSADEYAALITELVRASSLPLDGFDGAIIASVVPQLTPVLARAIERAFGVTALVVTSQLDLGIQVRVDHPAAVGADRLVNLVWLRERALRERNAPADAVLDHGYIAIDFGTATTLDCLSPAGEFVGGAIIPGARVCLDALVARTAQLPRIELSAPPRVVGRNTTEAMLSGIVYGYASLIEGMIDKSRAELGYQCRVVATGGLARLIARYAPSIESIEPDLTLLALAVIHARNTRSALEPK